MNIILKSGLTLLILFNTFLNLHSQKQKKTELKNANTLRIFIPDSSVSQAKYRFAEYMTKSGFPIYLTKSTVSTKDTKEIELNTTRNSSLQLNKIEYDPSLLMINKKHGDTIRSSIASLHNTMWGQFSAYIKYLIKENEFGEINITITGYVSTDALGFYTLDKRMQKSGKNTHWAQKDLFRRIEKYLNAYPGVENIIYLKDLRKN